MDSASAKNILGLQLPTDPRWVDLTAFSLEEILTDHAYCEQKAATSCISLIQRYSQYEELVAELGAAFLCQQHGIKGDLRHAGYIESWLKCLKSDSRAIFKASALAQQASDFLLACGTDKQELIDDELLAA